MTPGPAANFDLVVRYLREWVFPRWRSLAAVLLVTAGLAAATGGYPLIIKVSFDSLLKGDDSVLVLVLLAVVLITACRSTLMYFQNILSQQFIGRIAIDLQKLTLRRLVGLDYARLTAEAPGQSLSRVTNDVGFIANASSAALNSALKDTLSVAVLVGTMFYLDWVMSLVVLCIYPLAAWPIIKLSERLRTVARRTQSQLGNLTSLLTQIFTAPRLIKAYRLEDYVGRNASGQFEESFKLQMKALRTRARIDPMLEALGGVAVAGVIGLAYWRISGGSSTVGDFMGFVSALLMAAQPIRGLGSLAGRIQEGLVAASRVYGILDATPATVERPNAAPLNVTNGALRFDNVVFRYPGNGEPALRGLSLDIAPGTTVALVGQSGGGKSTLINLLPRLYDVSDGQILIDGQDIQSVTIDSLRDAIAFVSQDVALFDDTIAENIRLGRLTATDAEVEAAARMAAAHDFISEQPNGYQTVAGNDGIRLSGGQRQRIALARAILRDAPILLLDEATSALDAVSERNVQDALGRFAKDRTTLVIAHRLSTVQAADCICVLQDGELIEQGKHDELMRANGAYAMLYRTQFAKALKSSDATVLDNPDMVTPEDVTS